RHHRHDHDDQGHHPSPPPRRRRRGAPLPHPRRRRRRRGPGAVRVCDPSDITIATVKTGRVVGGLPEFQVTIGNECSCPEGDVVLSCLDGVPAGVDRSKIHAAGGSDGLCLVNDGLQIVKGSPVVFTYAASAPVSLAFDNASPRCQRR
ncbi:Os11g0224301, partial [Oryza sativa Japonica Group]